MENRTLICAVGPSVQSKKFINREFSWEDLTAWLKKSKGIDQTLAEYKKLSVAEQSRIKDTTCFIGGGLIKDSGRHMSDNIAFRDLLVLDADEADLTAIEDWTFSFTNAYLIYSTLKHTPKSPRLRIVIPLDRRVTADEFGAISHRIAADIGIEMFDPVSFKTSQPMYVPEHCADVEPYTDLQNGPFLSADEVLAWYKVDWHRQEDWPTSSREKEDVQKSVKKVGDPLAKQGLIGAFCRTYTISEAIEKFIPEVYTMVREGRYTYAKGTSAGGAVVYEDDHIMYSNHATDPAGGHAVNAFDLVRIHKFGEQDTPGNEKTSNKLMQDLAASDADTIRTLHTERYNQSIDEFKTEEPADPAEAGQDLSWTSDLKTDKNGVTLPTIDNVHTILIHDTNLTGIGGQNQLSGMCTLTGPVPWNQKHVRGDNWSDADEAGLRWYLEKIYEITGKQAITDALTQVQQERAFHPVRDYLSGLSWDGKPRLDTLLIDYLGAEDSEYVRAVTRKQITAAVYRVFDPGHKYDQMLTLVGPQGIGKSTLISKLGQTWYTDTVNSISGKDGYDAIQGAWIVEMSELAGLRKAEVEAVKQFISKRVDTYRRAYAKNTMAYPRQCVFFGSTNDDELLRDQTGNRRFWVVETGLQKHAKHAWDMDQNEVDQIWAEAVTRYQQHEALFLDDKLNSEAEKVQTAHLQSDARIGLIQAYLDILLPSDWKDRSLENRRTYIEMSMNKQSPEGKEQRTRVCAAEVLCELFGKDPGDIRRSDTVEINQLITQIDGWTRYKKSKGYMLFRIYNTQKAFVRTGSAGTVELSFPSEEDDF